MLRRRGVAVIASLVALGAILILLSSKPIPVAVDTGSRAPSFVLARLGEDPPLSLDSLEGRVVLVNFWATWCKPCEDEMPSMDRLYRGLRRERFELVAISVDEDRSVVEDFRDRHTLSFPILLDPERAVANAYQTYRFPESFLIDARGRVVERYVGPREWDAPEYAARIDRLLAAESGGR